MNVLVINGSPKGKAGNTYHLTKSFLDGLQANAEVVIEEIEVKDLNIESCRGCFGCWWGKNPGHCVIQDDMTFVIEKIMWADLVIWSFPLYYFSVPGKMKILIDRQLPMILPDMNPDTESGGHYSRFDFSKQKQVLISTCGFYTSNGNYDSVIKMFDHMFGEGNYETIFAGEGSMFSIEQAKPLTDPYLEEVKLAAAEFLAGGIKEETKASLSRVLYPREQYESFVNGVGH